VELSIGDREAFMMDAFRLTPSACAMNHHLSVWHSRKYGRYCLLALFVVLVAAVANIRCAQASSAAECVVRRVPNAKELRFDALYAGVAVASNDVWAVGAASNFKLGKETLAEHWDGATWSIVHTPSIDRNVYGPNLYGVAAISTSDVWAVGDYFDLNEDQFLTLALHWNGTRWDLVLPPNPEQNDIFNGVTSVKRSNSLWVIGTGGTQGSGFSFIEHFERGTWSLSYTASQAYLDGVASTSERSAWAVGTYTDAQGSQRPLALHWNGQVWSQTPTSALPAGSFDSVSAINDHDVWAVGVVSYNLSVRPFTAHWDGVSWTQMPTPVFGLRYATLNGVLMLSHDSIWVDGVTYTRIHRDPDATDIVAHWDGSSWTTLRAPEHGIFMSLYGIAGLPHQVWSLGRLDNSNTDGVGITDLSTC
jgi:hypothetical protein